MRGIDDERVHLRVWECLPWIVNGRSSKNDAEEMARHLRECRRCRAELINERTLYRRLRSGRHCGPEMESGLANLRRRIDEVEHEARAVSAVLAVSAVSAVPARSGPAMRFACVLAAIVVLQAGALVAMGVRPESDRTSPAYRTLFRIRPAAAGSRQMPRATIRLVVDDGMAAGRLQALLASLKLQIVGGPGESGIYSLAPLGASGDVDRTIEVLRAAPGVRFAEPASD